MRNAHVVKARVLADFEAELPGELTVSTRDEVLVVGAPVPQGWSLVIRGEESGLVPASYVEPLVALLDNVIMLVAGEAIESTLDPDHHRHNYDT